MSEKQDLTDCRDCGVHQPCVSSVIQTLDEMEWERGIWQAALSGDEDAVRKLIQKSNDPILLVQAKDNSEYTGLHYASRNGHYNVCKLLLKHGADMNSITKSTRATPLHRAASSGHKDIVKLLINSGADTSLQDCDGQTVLHKAAIYKHLDIYNIILEANPMILNILDNKGRSARDYLSNVQ